MSQGSIVLTTPFDQADYPMVHGAVFIQVAAVPGRIHTYGVISNPRDMKTDREFSAQALVEEIRRLQSVHEVVLIAAEFACFDDVQALVERAVDT